MPHFLISSKNILDNIVTVDEDENLAHLCFSMRVKRGENIKLIDENQISYSCKIVDIGKKYIKAEILNSEKSSRMLDFELNLIQCILKGDAQNLAISNATQLGVKKIQPVISDNVVIKNQKGDKWQRVANEAFKQCERADLVEVLEIEKLDDVLLDNIVVFGEKYADTTLKDAISNKAQINVVIGPEGGFSEREFEYFKDKKFPIVSLGNLILKAPNAISAALSNIIYEKNNG